MHPKVAEFIDDFERHAHETGQYRKSLGKNERIFLEQVWGPAFHYQFNGLRAEYPLKDFKGGDRFADFVYTNGGMRLLIEIDDFTTHARDISPGEFSDHLTRQNDLVLSGWFILRFSAHQVAKRSTQCQRQIMQALGHWWTIFHANFSTRDMDHWSGRKRFLAQAALRQEGIIRPADVARMFNVSHRTALHWLERFTSEGFLIPIKGKVRIVAYRLASVQGQESV
jgi:very-short-patch-repair endonuclease